MNDNPPTYTPLVLLQSSWRKIKRPSKETISKLYVGSSDQSRDIGRLHLSVPGATPNVKLSKNNV
jgi:hypothetical protein